MEGKVELPIERYEELTKIERDGFANVKELEANMDKIMILHIDMYGSRVRTEYQTKESCINNLIDIKTKAIAEKKAVEQKYNEASFWKRFKYLWTKKI